MSEISILNNQIAHTTYLQEYQIPSFLIDHVDLYFDLFEEFTFVRSRMKIRKNPACQEKSTELKLHGEELALESIYLNGKELPRSRFTLMEHSLTISDVPSHFDLEITVKIYPEKNTALSGLYRSSHIFCTQCEAEGFRRITYFLDQPDVLVRFTTTISADESACPTLLSNGNLVASGKQQGGRHWVKWEDPFKKPSYLFALVAGDFDLLTSQFVTMSKRKIQLNIFVEKGYLSQAAHAMYCLKKAMRWDEKTYGREYDLGIYMIVAISDFNMGAMENKGLNIFNTKYILAKPEFASDEDYLHIFSVIGHEYFHNWSGNRVTCRDWFQLSLKEGLTIFRDQSFSEDMLSHAVCRIEEVTALRESQFPEDAGPLAHPVRPESYIEINNFYTATIYNKGAEVLRMLQTLLGKTLFREGMDLYFDRYDGQAVTIEDYVSCMEEVSNMNLKQFCLWYSQAGTPIVHVSDDYDGAKKVYTLSFHQSCPNTPNQTNKEAMVIPIRLALLDKVGAEIPLQLENEKKETEKVLCLTADSQVYHFQNIDERPVPSLLRDFSAPIILNYTYSANDLLFLFKHDPDPFNRFESGQKYMLSVLLNLIRDYQQEKGFSLPSEMVRVYGELLDASFSDKLLLTKLLNVPSEKYIGEQMKIIDVDAIHAAREFLRRELADCLQAQFLRLYQQNQKSSQEFNPSGSFNLDEVSNRQLKNCCLHYLMLLPRYTELGATQFGTALKSNMTDTQAALVGLVHLDCSAREKALEQFYFTFKEEALAIDKWLAIQAISKLPNTLKQVKKLMRHESFNIKNPNKVYALIGTFCQRNHVHFHIENGEGYAFLREIVQQLDKLNPQIAARMVNPMTVWHRYGKERQALMIEQLKLLLQENKLSNDVYEMVSKSLEGKTVNDYN